MLEIDDILSSLGKNYDIETTFHPRELSLTDNFVSDPKVDDEEKEMISIDEDENLLKETKLNPNYPLDSTVIAIDSTSLCLGNISNGLMGVVRASVIIKPEGKSSHKMERYGPYIFPVTHQNKTELYHKLYKVVYNVDANVQAPDCSKMIDRVRNFLEKKIQFEIVKKYNNALILFDGSLIGGTVTDPIYFVQKVIDQSYDKGNSIAAISKHTGLTLRRSQRSILSLLEKVDSPCFIGGIKNLIVENRTRYLGDIFVAKLTPRGEPFRIDIPENSPVKQIDVLNSVSGLAGDYGYPEELKLAHMTCVLSAIEILELQAAAVALFGLHMEEDIKQKLFPL